jgi:hypothetical protein
MIAIPALLYLALKKRMKQEAGWQKYLAIAASVFVVLFIITKM